MVETFITRVNRRILEMEGRLQGKDGLLHPAPGEVDTNPPQPRSYIDDNINQYRGHLEKAYAVAPCGGCKRLVLGALTGLSIFESMSESGKARTDMSEEDIERIKKEVERKYANF